VKRKRRCLLARQEVCRARGKFGRGSSGFWYVTIRAPLQSRLFVSDQESKEEEDDPMDEGETVSSE